MPRQRLQIDDSGGVPGLRLATPAAPTDTYMRPNEEDSQAAQFASALSNLAPGLSRFGDEVFASQAKKNATQNKKDILAGNQAARDTISQLDDSRTTYADAVKSGKIPAMNNPWMKQGYYEELGRSYAGRLQSDLTTAIQEDANLPNSVEMGDYRKFTSGFEKDWLAKNVPDEIQNPAFQVGYGNRRDAIMQNLEAGWASQTEQRFTHRTLTMFADESQNFIHDALDKGRSVEDIGSFLRQTWDDKHALGWDSKLTGSALVDAMANVALDRRDPKLLEQLINSVPAGKDGSRLTTGYATAAVLKNQAQIADATRDDWTAQEHQRTETSRTIAADAATRFVDAERNKLDPDSVDVTDLRKAALANGDFTLERQIATMSKAYGKAEYSDDPDTVARLSTLLHRSATALKQSDLDQALEHKRLSLPTYNSMSGTLREYGNYATETAKADAQRGTPGFLEKDHDFQEVDRNLQRQFIGSNGLETSDLAHARDQAHVQFQSLYYDRFVAPGAPMAGLTGKAKIDAMNQLSFDVKQKWLPDASGAGVFTLKAGDMDWNKNLVDTPDRVQPWLDEMQAHLDGKTQAPPTPGLMSMLRIYGVDYSNRAAVEEFVKKQKSLLPPPPPKRKSTH